MTPSMQTNVGKKWKDLTRDERLTEKHLRACGRRLWTTGDYSRNEVVIYCVNSHLTDEQQGWVLTGWEDARSNTEETK